MKEERRWRWRDLPRRGGGRENQYVALQGSTLFCVVRVSREQSRLERQDEEVEGHVEALGRTGRHHNDCRTEFTGCSLGEEP